ncbi:MAG: hypothetical protein ACHQU0_02870, partial [Candidatus Paceibacteria bacterium]
YTGLDLGPVGTVLYWLILIGGSIALAYAILFIGVPFADRSARSFGERVQSLVNAERAAPVAAVAKAPAPVAVPLPKADTSPETARSYSSYEGFKSFARSGALSIEDIVKGLSREHLTHVMPVVPEPVVPVVEAVVETVAEPVPAAEEMPKVVETTNTLTDAHGFASALVGGDREAVFAGLRQHVRGGGAPERLVSSVACLLDDTYRSRMDGTVCDATLERLSARLDTPTLEKLVGALTTAIDSSYSDSVTGAKLAFTRALSVLGA